jgi:hypothetical protein
MQREGKTTTGTVSMGYIQVCVFRLNFGFEKGSRQGNWAGKYCSSTRVRLCEQNCYYYSKYLVQVLDLYAKLKNCRLR